MAALSNYLENKLVDFLFRGQVFPSITTLYFSLHTASVTDAGTGTEVSGGSYARVAVVCNTTNFSSTTGDTTLSGGTEGYAQNLVDIMFPTPTANWGTVTYMGVWDALSGGNLLFWGPVSPSKVVNSGDAPPKFSANQWRLTLDY